MHFVGLTPHIQQETPSPCQGTRQAWQLDSCYGMREAAGVTARPFGLLSPLARLAGLV